MNCRRIGIYVGHLSVLFLAAALARPVAYLGAVQGSGIKLEGLNAQVTVRRDERGIPYIEAANDSDLYFAQGYVTASDRLWQMDLNRRTVLGELAEILGRPALEADKQFRNFGFAALSEALATNCPPSLRAPLEAYSRGVNAFIASLNEKSLPPECAALNYKPRPWRPSDSIAIGKLFSFTLSMTYRSDLTRAALSSLPREQLEVLLPETSPLDVVMVGRDSSEPDRTAAGRFLRSAASTSVTDQTVSAALSKLEAVDRALARIGLSTQHLQASNNWVVSGKRTASGKPMLANDPHLPPSAPSIWYLTHLNAPGLRVAGVTSPGIPGIVIGHNDRIAWGVTNFMPDVQDLYVEKFDVKNPLRYKSPQGWSEAEVRREVIKVRKGFGSAETEPVEHEVVVTRHGPIILRQGGNQYALRWTALDRDSKQFETFLKINRARNWPEFREALSRFTEPAQNFVYADTNGHIGYYAAGLIPIRKTGDGTLPYDGSSDEGEWKGYIPFEELPHLYDPPSGIIVTANNRTIGLSYPYVITREWVVPYRARRIFDLLQARPKLTQEDFREIQGDLVSIGGKNFARETVKVLMPIARAEDDSKLIQTLQMLAEWDGKVGRDSAAAALVWEMRAAFRKKILMGVLGAERWQTYQWTNSDTFVDKIITERPARWLPNGVGSYSELLKKCYEESRSAIAARLGPDESTWRWGHPALAQVRFNHPLAAAPLIGSRFQIAPFPQDGSAGALVTVNAGSSVSMRVIIDTADWDRTLQGIALGQSGNPSSNHWKDQLEDWRSVAPRTLPFSKGKVEQAAKEIVILTPAN